MSRLAKFEDSIVPQNLRLESLRRQSIKQLSGFESRLRMPDSADRRIEFLGRIAEQEFDQDLDDLYRKLKDQFGFKRRNLIVSDPVDGSAGIQTDAFHYQVNLLVCPESIEHVIWQRCICFIQQVEILSRSEFQTVFGDRMDRLCVDLDSDIDITDVIDHFEDLAPEDIEIDYDRQATWCELTIHGSTAKMRIQSDQFVVTDPKLTNVVELFECYFELQDRLLAKII